MGVSPEFLGKPHLFLSEVLTAKLVKIESSKIRIHCLHTLRSKPSLLNRLWLPILKGVSRNWKWK